MKQKTAVVIGAVALAIAMGANAYGGVRVPSALAKRDAKVWAFSPARAQSLSEGAFGAIKQVPGIEPEPFAGKKTAPDALAKAEPQSSGMAPDTIIAPPLDTLLAPGIKLMKEGRARKALRIFEQARDSYPDSAEAYVWMGRAYGERAVFGRWKHVACFQVAEDIVETDPVLRHNPQAIADVKGELAYAYFNMGQYKCCLDKLSEAATIAPNDYRTHYALAEFYYMIYASSAFYGSAELSARSGVPESEALANARGCIGEALLKNTGNPGVPYLAAVVEYALGDMALAKKHIGDAKSLMGAEKVKDGVHLSSIEGMEKDIALSEKWQERKAQKEMGKQAHKPR